MAKLSALASITPNEAEEIITALRKGVPPEKGAELYSVGRKDLLAYFDQTFGELRNKGISDIKFVSGDWGHGKSHFLDLLRDLALRHNFVVSKVELKSGEVSFDQLPLVIQRMMDNLVTPNVRENGLEVLLNEWSRCAPQETESALFSALENQGIDGDMRLKLVEYRRYRNAFDGPQYERCLQVVRWFQGRETRSRMWTNVPRFLKSFVKFVRHIGYSGLVVLLDEAEAITSLSRVARVDLANENVRQVIDNDQATKYFYLVFASTPSFLSGEHEHGAQSYPALWRRIRHQLPDLETKSLKKVIVELPELSEPQLAEVGIKIKAIYQKACGKMIRAVTENNLKVLANYVMTQQDRSIGTLVRGTVQILDDAVEGGFDFMSKFELIVGRVMKQEAIDRAR
jgi:hypothetical protein